MFLLTGLGIVGENEQYGSNQQHDAHDEQAGTKGFLNLILKEYTHDAHRDHRHQNVEGVLGLGIHLELKEAFQNPVDLLPQDDERRKHRGYMYSYGKLQILLTVDAKEMRDDREVTTRADGQVLSESLNNAQY